MIQDHGRGRGRPSGVREDVLSANTGSGLLREPGSLVHENLVVAPIRGGVGDGAEGACGSSLPPAPSFLRDLGGKVVTQARKAEDQQNQEGRAKRWPGAWDSAELWRGTEGPLEASDCQGAPVPLGWLWDVTLRSCGSHVFSWAEGTFLLGERVKQVEGCRDEQWRD